MTGEKLAQRNYYGKALAALAKEDPKVVVIDADLAGSTKTSDFQKVCPERFVEVGIAEQNMIGIASGLAASGKTVCSPLRSNTLMSSGGRNENVL